MKNTDNVAEGAAEEEPKVDRDLARVGYRPKGSKPPLVVRPKSGDAFFTIYKKGQGYWTRMGTAAAAILIGALTANFLYEQRSNFRLSNHGGMILVGMFCIGYALLCFFLINRATNAEFLIATDSEMKKVNWTSKKELTGSTQVVILFMFLMAAFLFTCDLFFSYFFHLIGVLKAAPI